MVLALREVLSARGVPGEQVSAKAYWGRGKANAQHGEPAATADRRAPYSPAATKTSPRRRSWPARVIWVPRGKTWCT